MSTPFHVWVKTTRKARGLTQQKAADIIGWTDQQWAAMENGYSRRKDGRPPQHQRATIETVARALGVPAAEALAAAGYLEPDPEPEEIAFAREILFALEGLSVEQRHFVKQTLCSLAQQFRAVLCTGFPEA
jgi:transcriptional regulator with XRE-family HTH domain